MKIFCSGIGGIGLSAYAALQHAAGHDVHGSDCSDSALIADLKSQGITVTLKQDGSAVPKDLDLFVYSEAIPEDAPERRIVRERNVRSISYFQALGEITKGKRLIAVCGTHGKSSTTAMAARVLIAAGLDPTVVVGTKVRELDGRNWRKGRSDLCLVEACEYRKSFHFLSPSIVVMTNVDGDHFDAYKNIDDYRASFTEFLRMLPKDGPVITHGSDKDCLAVAQSSGRSAINADAFAAPQLRTPGEHMRQNGKLVLALAVHLGIDAVAAREALAGFAGTWRRMELAGITVHDIPVIDDYAHHPVEIRATLAAMKEAFPDRRIVVAFQPHTHDRTKKLYKYFLSCLSNAEIVVLPNIYNARSDIEHGEVDLAQFIADIAKESDAEVIDGKGMENTEKLLRENILKSGDLLVVMGAGDVTQLAKKMVG